LAFTRELLARGARKVYAGARDPSSIKHSTVAALRLDVTKPEEIAAAVKRVRDTFGALHGVVHAAGLPGGALLQAHDDAAAARVLAPKVQGTLALEQALLAERLDFLLLCSSITANVGRLGQADYAAANAFMEAYAAYRRRASQGSKLLAVAWGRWRGVGMASAKNMPVELQQLGEADKGFTASMGVEAFERLLQLRTPVVVVSDEDVLALVHEAKSGVPDILRFREALEASSKRVRAKRPELATPFVAPESDVEQRVATVWAETLGLDEKEVGVNDNFFEVGGTSLSLSWMHRKLQAHFGKSFPLVQLFEHPTVRAIAASFSDGGTQQKQEQAHDEAADRAQKQREARHNRRRGGRV
jgi:phthiocerol/phenolphthiocerol synthesis type-I polyketide synthase E